MAGHWGVLYSRWPACVPQLQHEFVKVPLDPKHKKHAPKGEDEARAH